MVKKPYTAPTVTDHGSVVTKTKGTFGGSFEFMGWRELYFPPPPADDGDDKIKP